MSTITEFDCETLLNFINRLKFNFYQYFADIIKYKLKTNDYNIEYKKQINECLLIEITTIQTSNDYILELMLTITIGNKKHHKYIEMYFEEDRKGQYYSYNQILENKGIDYFIYDDNKLHGMIFHNRIRFKWKGKELI